LRRKAPQLAYWVCVLTRLATAITKDAVSLGA
jgi:hypothetical protein